MLKQSEDDILKWVDFLYHDLLDDSPMIGGYYFRFSDLVKYEDLIQSFVKQERDRQIEYIKLRAQKAPDSQIDELIQAIHIRPVKLQVRNKHFQELELTCTGDEFQYVVTKLIDYRDKIRQFKDFIQLEAKKVKEEDKNSFMWFINDLYQDLRNKIIGNSDDD